MKGFTQSEVALLTDMAKEGVSQGKNLTKVFNEFAQSSGRATGSIRNFYYSMLKTEQGKKSGLTANTVKPFSKCETVNLIKEILVGCANGKSVRRVIAELSKGAEKQALRIQNKYRNVIAKEKSLVENVKDGLTKMGIAFKDPYEQKTARRGFLYNRLEGEINRLFEKIALKEKKINASLTERIKELELENQRLKQNVVVSYYVKKKNKERKEINLGK